MAQKSTDDFIVNEKVTTLVVDNTSEFNGTMDLSGQTTPTIVFDTGETITYNKSSNLLSGTGALIEASNLKTSTGTLSVSGSVPSGAGEVLISDSATQATWTPDAITIKYDTVALLQAADLDAGRFVETKGYTTEGDDGHGTYYITSGDTSNGLDKILLANGNTANLKGPMFIEQFGASSGALTLSTTTIAEAFLTLLENLNSKQATTVTFPSGTVSISSGDLATINSGTSNITLSGSTPVSTTFSAVTSSSGSVGAWDIDYTLASSSGISIGDVVMITDVLPGRFNATTGAKTLLNNEAAVGFYRMGEITVSSASTQCTVSGGTPITYLTVGDLIHVQGQTRTVASIDASPALTFDVDSNFDFSITGLQWWYYSTAGTGTCSTVGASTTITFSSSITATEMNVGDLIVTMGEIRVIESIDSATDISVDHNIDLTTANYSILASGILHEGCFEITNLVGTTMTVRNKSRVWQPPINRIASGTVVVLKTILENTGTGNGLVFKNNGSILIENMALFGNDSSTTSAGIALNGFGDTYNQKIGNISCGDNVAILNWGYGVTQLSGSILNGNGMHICGNLTRGVDCADGAIAYLRSAVISHNVGIGILISGGHARLSSANVCGNSLQGIRQDVGSSTYGDQPWAWGNGSHGVMLVNQCGTQFVDGASIANSGNGINFQNTASGRISRTLFAANNSHNVSVVNGKVEGTQCWFTGAKSGQSGIVCQRSEVDVQDSASTGNSAIGYYGTTMGKIIADTTVSTRNATGYYSINSGTKINALNSYSSGNTTAVTETSGGVVFWDSSVYGNYDFQSININATTNSTSTSTGSLVTAGGAGIAQDVFIGGDVTMNTDASTLTIGSGGAGLNRIVFNGPSVNDFIISQSGSSFGSVDSAVSIYVNCDSNNNQVTEFIQFGQDGTENTASPMLRLTEGATNGSNSTARFYSATDASNSTTAGVILDGGLAVAKGQYVGTFLNVGTTLDVGGISNFNDTTDASNSTTAGVILDGGLAVAKGQYVGTFLNVGTTLDVGGISNFDDTTDTSSSSTGALIVDGGLSVAKGLYNSGILTILADSTSVARLQTAITADIKHIILGPGTHTFAAAVGAISIASKNDLVIEGSGQECTVLDGLTNEESVLSLSGTCDSVTIRNMTISCSGTSNVSILGTGTLTNITIENCTFRTAIAGNDPSNILNITGDSFLIRNCNFIDCECFSTFLDVSDIINSRITNCNFIGCSSTNFIISADASSNLTVCDNLFADISSGYLIYANASVINISIQNNTIYNCTLGQSAINVRAYSGVLITDNNIHVVTGNRGVWLGSNGLNPDRVVISNNTIYGGYATAAIYIDEAPNVVIANNFIQVLNSGDVCIQLDAGADNTVISNNRMVVPTGAEGLVIASGSINNAISNNLITGSGTLYTNSNTLVNNATNSIFGNIINGTVSGTSGSTTNQTPYAIYLPLTTDASSSTVGGSFTTDGGLAVGKSAYIGTTLDVGTDLTVLGNAILGNASSDLHNIIGTMRFGETGSNVNITTEFRRSFAATASSNASTIFSGLNTITTAATGTHPIISNHRLYGSTITDGGSGPATVSATMYIDGAPAGTGISATDNHAIYVAGGTMRSITSTASTSNTTGSLLLAGGLGISNATDASSSTNGGSITTAGGLAVAQSAYIGTTMSISGVSTTNTNQTNTDSNEATDATTATVRYTLNATTVSTSVLASGSYPGQMICLRLVTITAGTTLTITGTGFTSLVLDDVDDYYSLVWNGTEWSGIGGNLAGGSAAFNA